MILTFSGRLQGVYPPKDSTKFDKRVPLNIVARGVIQCGSEQKVGITADQVNGYRCTLWVSADTADEVITRLQSYVGSAVSFQVDHVLVPVKLGTSATTSLVWRDTLLLDTVTVE